MTEYTESDYIVEKLAGRLNTKFKTWEEMDDFHQLTYEQSQLHLKREETFEEWKARKEQV